MFVALLSEHLRKLLLDLGSFSTKRLCCVVLVQRFEVVLKQQMTGSIRVNMMVDVLKQVKTADTAGNLNLRLKGKV